MSMKTDEKLDAIINLIISSKDEVLMQFDEVSKRFDAVDKRFDTVDKRFDGVDKRIDGLERSFELSLDIRERLAALEARIEQR